MHTQNRPDTDSLWLLTIAPAIWAAHLMASYITAAVWCAKFAAPGGALGNVRTAIAWFTVVALIGIGLTGWQGFKRHSWGAEATTHDLDSPGDRHRFLGFATLLLSGLSGVATIYVAMAAIVFENCR